MLQIPLVEGLNSTIETTINEKTYTFVTKWNDRFGYYSMDVKVASSIVVAGIILVAGVDIATSTNLELSRVYCINKNEVYGTFGYSGLGDDGLVVIVEDSDLEE